jgi:hypothetical protein
MRSLSSGAHSRDPLASPGVRCTGSGTRGMCSRRYQVICPSGGLLTGAVESFLSDFPKNICSLCPKSNLELSHPTPPEGRIMIVTDAGRGAVDAAVLGVRCERRADCSP